MLESALFPRVQWHSKATLLSSNGHETPRKTALGEGRWHLCLFDMEPVSP